MRVIDEFSNYADYIITTDTDTETAYIYFYLPAEQGECDKNESLY